MKRNTKDQMIYYTFEHFESTGQVRHLFTSRHGGFSQGDYQSMNMIFNGKEPRETVLKNYGAVEAATGIKAANMVLSRQTHGNVVKVVTQADRGKGIVKPADYDHIDGLVTNVKNTALVTFHADCVPIFLLDPVQGVIGLAHAGWRGTAGFIARKAVQAMQQHYQSNPKDILAGIGPSICKECFEADYPVAEQFEKTGYGSFIRQGLNWQNEKKYYIDLKGINQAVLLGCGLKGEHIEVTPLCTKCENTVFYSHRAHGARRGNMAAILELVE